MSNLRNANGVCHQYYLVLPPCRMSLSLMSPPNVRSILRESRLAKFDGVGS